MKTKIPFLTRLARFVLLVAIILQVLILLLQYVSYFQSSSLQSLLGNFANIIGLEFYFSLTEAFVFRRLFLERERGKVRGWFGWLVMLLIFGFLDYSGTIMTLLQGGKPEAAEMLGMTLSYIAPILILLAIVTGSRLLSLLAVMGQILITLWNLNVLVGMRIVMGEAAVAAMLLIELLEGLGIVIGLLAITFHRKPVPEEDRLSAESSKSRKKDGF